MQEPVDAALRLLEAFGYYGLSQVEFKRDPRDGGFKLMEINPRLWQWHGLATACGVDLPRIAYDDLVGESSPPPATMNGAGKRWAITLLPGEQPGPAAAALRRRGLRARRPEARRRAPRTRRAERASMIPAVVERRARWVLDSIGATELGFGDDLPYDADAWEQIDRGERPVGDDARRRLLPSCPRRGENTVPRDEHGRFRAEWSCLDPLDPPLERLRRRLGVSYARRSDRASRSRSRTTSTRRGAGRASACAVRPHG